MQCAFCSRPITPRFAWKASSDQFYCSEFCADSEGATLNPASVLSESASVPVRHQHRTSTLLDHHLSRPYERLEKLLPYMRQRRAAAGAQRETTARAA